MPLRHAAGLAPAVVSAGQTGRLPAAARAAAEVAMPRGIPGCHAPSGCRAASRGRTRSALVAVRLLFRLAALLAGTALATLLLPAHLSGRLGLVLLLFARVLRLLSGRVLGMTLILVASRHDPFSDPAPAF